MSAHHGGVKMRSWCLSALYREHFHLRHLHPSTVSLSAERQRWATPRLEGNQTAKELAVVKRKNIEMPTDPVSFSALIAINNLITILTEAREYLRQGEKLSALGTLILFDDLAQDIYAAIRFLRMDRRQP